MQHMRFLLVAGVALAWHSTVQAGVPGWCKHPSNSEYREEAKDAWSNIRYLVEGCGPQAGPAWDKAYADFSKRYGMNEQDWADADEWVHERAYSDGPGSYKVQGTTLATLSPIDQYLLLVGYSDAMDSLYRADALEQNLTQVGRVAVLSECIKEHDNIDFPVFWAVCQDDVAKLDVNKLWAELRGDKSQPAKARTVIRLKLLETLDSIKTAEAAYAELVKKDDAYKKLLDVAAKGRDTWTKQLADKKDLLALAQQLDSATYFHSKKQFAGCEDQARKFLTDAAASFSAKTFTGFDDEKVTKTEQTFAGMFGPILVADPQMNLTATAYALCMPQSGTAKWLGGWLNRIPGYRGPRDAAWTAITLEKFPVDDTRQGEIKKPRPDIRPYREIGSSEWSWGGVASKLKPEGDHVIISQPKSSVTTEDCVSWHETGKIQGWDTAGRLVYQSVCTKFANVKHDTTPRDQKVSAATAAWVKTGMRFEAVGGENDTNADVVATWPKGGKLPDTLFGAKIK